MKEVGKLLEHVVAVFQCTKAISTLITQLLKHNLDCFGMLRQRPSNHDQASACLHRKTNTILGRNRYVPKRLRGAINDRTYASILLISN
jgi:hypothetical protein